MSAPEMLPSLEFFAPQFDLHYAFKEVQFARVNKTAPFAMPGRVYPGDAGFDLACSDDYRIEPGKIATVRTNIAVALPNGVWAMITGRSSTFHKLGLITNQGIIDNGYRGELFASIYNSNQNQDVVIKTGDRLIQLIMFPLIVPQAVEVEELPTSHRGTNGFGSSGK